jgi:hypothetical protein
MTTTLASVIAIDDETTWPEGLRRTAHDGLMRIRAELAANPEPLERWAYADMITAADAQLEGMRVVGYHATRLRDPEIEAIRCDGLCPLDPDHTARRIRAAVVAGDFSAAIGEKLLAESLAEDDPRDLRRGRRQNMLWFVFTRDLLRNEGGLWSLFTFWGGEAIYMDHADLGCIEPVGTVSRALRDTGTACIVKAAVSVNEIEAGPSLGEALIECFLASNSLQLSSEPGLEGFIRTPVLGRHLQIFRRRDPEFEQLTACGIWQGNLT